MTHHTPQFDTSLRPQDDFFGYINNPWIAAHPIPPTESSWGTFYQLRDNAADAVHAITDDLTAADAGTLTPDQQRIQQFFTTALTYPSLAQAHYATLRGLLDEIEAIASPRDLARYIGRTHRRGQSPFWTPYVDHDDKDSQLQVLRFHQSGLTLPNRDYYLDQDDHMCSVRGKYQTFYEELQSHLPELVTPQWQQVMTIETDLATHAWTQIELRDIAKNYHRYDQASLRADFTWEWDAYFEGLGWETPNDALVVSQPDYLNYALSLCTDIASIKDYLRWRAFDGLLSWIDETTTELAFGFFGTVLTGVTEQKPLWKRVVQLVDSLVIGEVVGREYAAKHFPEASKQAVLAIVETIRTAYHARLDRLTWMSDVTRQRAHTKLDNMAVLIGYPNTWKDFSSLQLSDDNLLTNLLAVREFDSALDLVKVGQPPAKEEWEMHAHTVNAYHHPNRLEIVFPAAILQPPFYDPAASLATNLGGIGAVIGHEFTHGFDDQGADFDEHGNTNRWQTPSERCEFDRLAQFIVQQADAYETAPGVTLQGQLVLGEAIADIGGLALAVEAYQMQSPDDDLHPGLKELFINFARCECGHATLERAIQLAKIDPHPPSRFRVNCVVCHVDEFYNVYEVSPHDKLYLSPASRAKIW